MTPTRPSRKLWCLVFLFLCCGLSPSSSSSSTSSQINKTSSSRVITRLPGFDGPLPFHLQTGYVEVDEGNGVRLFYYFVRSERSPADDPLMLWLTGGPGCSVLTGLAYEIGPLRFDLDGHVHGLPKLLYNQNSWTKWFDEHPEFLSNPLYIAGDSYSGKIVPTVTSQITRGIQAGSEPSLNLKGYLMGNPVTDPSFDEPSKIPFAHGMGLISDEMYEAYKKSCSVGEDRHQTIECTNSLDDIDEGIKDINTGHILEPLCTFASPHPNKPTPKITSSAREMLQLLDYTEDEELNLSEISSKCRTAEYLMSRTWANNASVREALGIHEGTVPSWIRCNYDIPYTCDIRSTVKYYLDVTTKGYRSLVYSGDHDLVVPFIGTQAWIKSLNFSVVDKWRPWYVDGQVAGYTRSYSNNLTFATVKGGGHTAPGDMPSQCFTMFERWVSAVGCSSSSATYRRLHHHLLPPTRSTRAVAGSSPISLASMDPSPSISKQVGLVSGSATMTATRPSRELWCLVFIFLCCGLSCSSSSSTSRQFNKSNSSRIITHLPGFDGPIPFHLETGYVEVDEGNGVRLFYYFVLSERSPADDPLMLWLTGGPGCSVLTGLAYEIGPLSFDLDGHVDGLPKLLYNQNSWTKLSNIIFLDSPVGAGFSYSETEQGYNSSDTKAVNHIIVFLSKWFDDHPEFLSNPLYIAGDSYSGKIVPTVTSQIIRGIQVGSEPPLNLKGYLVGNPVTDSSFDKPSKIPFAHGMGLISDEMYEAYKKSCSVGEDRHQTIECANSLDDIDDSIKDICTNHILEPLCTFASPHPNKPMPTINSSAREMLQLQDYTEDAELHLSEISLKCRTAGYLMSKTWANSANVREALGIHKGTVPSWIRCNYDIPYTSDIRSTVKYHLDVTTKGYRSLVYSGDHDLVVPYIGTQAWIKSLNFSVVDKWRPWYVDGQVAGYTRSYSNNLTFATVKGGGHTAPEFMPRQCFAMFERWISVHSRPNPTVRRG
ncbi:hypothetical protein EJB05_23167 [Eragrostis curvula]|uniref:Uncharacterized protein n=1 Tax=Eragrostis curvula TaxID=38414 RepID=A0A5J9V9A4_9POAL|nr:hypothetical protein EJB05_23167 [Eragrostis curvula]